MRSRRSMLVVGLVLSCLTWAETTMARNAPPAETAALILPGMERKKY